MKAVFIYNHNPVAVHPRQREMRAALLSEDLFVVGSDVSMTDSMACADLVLPAAGLNSTARHWRQSTAWDCPGTVN